MKITNLYDLPSALVSSAQRTFREPVDGVVHVTELIAPVQQSYLKRRYNDNIEVDVADTVWALFGIAAHYLLSNYEKVGKVETALEFPLDEGWKLVGRSDLYHDGVVSDYKFTSVWSFILGDKEEWEQQLNIYALLFEEAGYAVRELQIVALLRDWKLGDYMKRPEDYPPSQVYVKQIPLWGREQTLNFVRNRWDILKQALVDDITPDCSNEERWARPTVYAVSKANTTRAVKGGLFDDFDSAVQYAKLLGKEHEVYVRLGRNVRCEGFCSVRDFCPQFTNLMETK